MILGGCIKKRLYANGIAGEKQEITSQIEDGEGKNAVEFLHAGGAGFLIQMNDDFGVCLRMKPMAPRFKMQTLFLEIIYLAVEDEPDGPVFVRHRLAPCRRDVENGKSIVSNSNTLRNRGRSKAAEFETIRAAMADRA